MTLSLRVDMGVILIVSNLPETRRIMSGDKNDEPHVLAIDERPYRACGARILDARSSALLRSHCHHLLLLLAILSLFLHHAEQHQPHERPSEPERHARGRDV